MADLREVLIAIAEFHERAATYDGEPYKPIHGAFARQIREALAAHPQDESEKRLEAVKAAIDSERAKDNLSWDTRTALDWVSIQVASALDPKPTTEPDVPKAAQCDEWFTCHEEHLGFLHAHQCTEPPQWWSRAHVHKFAAPSSEVRELRVPEPFYLVLRFGGRTALGLNPNEIEELWRAITNEIEIRIEARAAARKPK